jgi:hypothetical protein
MQSELNAEHLTLGQNLHKTINYLENAMTGVGMYDPIGHFV